MFLLLNARTRFAISVLPVRGLDGLERRTNGDELGRVLRRVVSPGNSAAPPRGKPTPVEGPAPVPQ